jgi:hypothetical protein
MASDDLGKKFGVGSGDPERDICGRKFKWCVTHQNSKPNCALCVLYARGGMRGGGVYVFERVKVKGFNTKYTGNLHWYRYYSLPVGTVRASIVIFLLDFNGTHRK